MSPDALVVLVSSALFLIECKRGSESWRGEQGAGDIYEQHFAR